VRRLRIKSLPKWGWLAALLASSATVSLWWLSVRPDVGQLVREATQAAKQGETAASIRLFDAALRWDPHNGMALLYRGQLARDAGDTEAALAFWRRVPDSPMQQGGTARFLEGTVWLENNQTRRAEQALLKAVELHPAYRQPHERLLQLYVVQLRAAELREQLQIIRGFRPWTLDELVIYQGARGKINRASASIPQLEKYLEADPHDLLSALALARYYLIDDQAARATELLSRMRAEHPEETRVLGLLAESWLVQSEFSKAREVLGESLPAEAAHEWFWRSRGLYAFAVEDWPRAVICLERAAAADPEDVGVAYQLGLALERAGHPAAAKRQLARTRLVEKLFLEVSRILGGDRNRTDLSFGIVMEVGRLLMRLDRPSDAVFWFEQAVTWQPQNSAARTGLAEARERSAAEVPFRTDYVSLVQSAVAAEQPVPSVLEQPRERNARASPLPRIELVDEHAPAGLDFQYFNGASNFKYLMESLGGGVAVLDYDGDGWPDLYFTQGSRLPFDAQDASHLDRLYRNAGNGTFLDVTAQAGLRENQYSQGCTAGDYDNDGDPDLIVANFGINTVYRNNGDGTFTDATATVGLRGNHWSSSLALADFNRDGNLDLYVVNYLLNPWRTCRTDTGELAACSPGNFSGEQDLLYENRGDGTFEDVTEQAGIVASDGKGLGIVVSDLNGDGWPDIYVANDGTPNFLFRNLGADGTSRSPRFVEEGMADGVAVSGDGSAQAGMGIACADLNRDGLLDLYVTNFYLEVNTLYVNQGNLLFNDRTRSAHLDVPTKPMLGFGTQAVDLDADGNPELFVANGHINDNRRRGEPWKMPPQLFYNLGNTEFSEISTECGPYFHEQCLGRGVAKGDWNRDGREDLVVVHQDRPAALLLNRTRGGGNWLGFQFHGIQSNRDAIGVKVKVTCGDRIFVHELCGGDGFFASNQRLVLVGIGSASQADRVEVVWPSGTHSAWTNVPGNTSWILREGNSKAVLAGGRAWGRDLGESPSP
jgi:tetratricopeptide (TPR) repeat protein